MSWLERRASGTYHVAFRLGNQTFKRSLKTTRSRQAEATRARLDENIQLVESGRLALPPGGDAGAFLLSDAKLTSKPSPAKTLTLSDLFADYLGSLPDGCMEENSLYTVSIHMKHFQRVLGATFAVGGLRLSDLQEYVRQRAAQGGKRGKRVSPTTIRKELGTLRAVWSWATCHGLVQIPFPNKGLRFPKISEKPPFQTRAEIDRQLSCKGLSEAEKQELWDCLYLTLADIDEVLALVPQLTIEGTPRAFFA
jgi:hypothetical protein